MGLSVSASFAIIAVGLFIGIGYLTEAAFYSFDSVMKGAQEVAYRKMDWARTRIAFQNATLNGSSVMVNLTNTGSTVLAVSSMAVVVNGTYVERANASATVEGVSTNIWSPGERLTMALNITADPSNRLLVATGNGVLVYGVIA